MILRDNAKIEGQSRDDRKCNRVTILNIKVYRENHCNITEFKIIYVQSDS